MDEAHGTIEAVLDDRGWVVVPGAAADLVDPLGSLARAVGLGQAAGTAFSDHALDAEARASVHREVGRLVGPLAELLVPGHRIASASLVVKGAGDGSAIDWHLDPSITDERRWRSLSLWIPLVEVGPGRGGLELLDGGHRSTLPDRGGRRRLVETHPPHATSIEAAARRAGAPTGALVLQPGDVVVYDHRVPHRSDASHGAVARPAVNVGLLPVDAPLVVYLWPNGTPEPHPVPEDFFVRADLGAEPADWFADVGDPSRPTTDPS